MTLAASSHAAGFTLAALDLDSLGVSVAAVRRRDYRYPQQLGRYLKEQYQNGLLVRSARSRGTNADPFTPGVLSRVRDLCLLTYRVNPARDLVRVERTPGRKWLEFRPSSLR